MSEKIKIAITGYGNIGKGVELAVNTNDDMELVAVFTRRNPKDLQIATKTAKVLHVDDAQTMQDNIDVMILCSGSATDLPVQGPQFASMFHTIDSFDTHAKIPEYFEAVNKAASESNHVSIISVGWDPGMFSINRIYAESILPMGSHYTFWGKGVSQGHSDALRRIKGVKNAIQYTIPLEEAIEAAKSGNEPILSTREKHARLCYVVAEESADKTQIEKEIKTMPNYFDEYDTTVYFISEKELKVNHNKMPHGGFVIRSGKTNNGKNHHVIEYSLKLDSNPEFTGSILAAYARAAYKLSKQGQFGAKTVFDIAPALLSPKSAQEIRKNLL